MKPDTFTKKLFIQSAYYILLIIQVFIQALLSIFVEEAKYKKIKDPSNQLAKIKKDIAGNNLNKALNDLLVVAQSKNYEYVNTILLLMRRYNCWQEQMRRGLKPKQAELNEISLALLDIVDELG